MKQAKPINPPGKSLHRFFLRGPWENFATVIIALGVFMLMQPFFKWAFTYSFAVLLAGFVCFTIVSHFPAEKE